MFEDLEDDEFLDDEYLDDDENRGNEGGNRNFLLIAGILGGITVVAILCLGGIFLYQNTQNNRAGSMTEIAYQTATQVEIEMAIQETAVAAAWTDTPTVTPEPSETPEPTEVVVLPSATEESATENPATATIAALLTQAAQQPTTTGGAGITITALVTATGLPSTGIFDDLGVTSLILLAFFAIIVIFLARRLRSANS